MIVTPGFGATLSVIKHGIFLHPPYIGDGPTRTWWFGCHFEFSHVLGISSSQLTFIYFFRGVAQPPTTIDMHLFKCHIIDYRRVLICFSMITWHFFFRIRRDPHLKFPVVSGRPFTADRPYQAAVLGTLLLREVPK